MDLQESRTWILFYLISFVVLLVSVFLTSEGILVGVGLTMLIVVIGINLMFMLSQVKEATKKKEMMDKISHIDRKGAGDNGKR
ncbi:hypothetical protein [Methanogenium sp. MK-MG]|uniref:hypothetical protein n=1 Tax=Methanogenium sp. MK-MG TaxID=2599926 RepID=UPI0013EA6E35|nr:hypothetical protein [Methanogenium sp. MK-MG]KAF1073634.1 hypothetical protein MKMG_02116 [Methanogenium sp. MK-MG]